MEFNNTMLKVIINEVSKLHEKSDELNLVLEGIPCEINDFFTKHKLLGTGKYVKEDYTILDVPVSDAKIALRYELNKKINTRGVNNDFRRVGVLIEDLQVTKPIKTTMFRTITLENCDVSELKGEESVYDFLGTTIHKKANMKLVNCKQ